MKSPRPEGEQKNSIFPKAQTHLSPKPVLDQMRILLLVENGQNPTLLFRLINSIIYFAEKF